MDITVCLTNLTGCLASLGLKRCDADKDTCFQHGLCITTLIPSSLSICICDLCYYGERCEKERFSNNLWSLGSVMLHTPGTFFAVKFLSIFFSCVQIINCLICLQTYLSSKKIRITNIGVYLILYSIISLLLGLQLLIQSVLLLYALDLGYDYWRISCFIDRKFVYTSFTFILGWTIFLIGLERLLIECFHYGLYDSRKRSFILIIVVSIICCLTTIPGIFTLKNIPEDQLLSQILPVITPISCINYSSVGYIIDKIILSVHVYGTFLCYIILCIIVVIHMLRHRKRIAPNYTTQQNIRFILRNHRDFFIPLVSLIICSTPMIIINEMMTCAKASQIKSIPYLLVIFGYVFTFLPVSLSFFLYIYPANVYMVAFRRQSFLGRCLFRLKT